MFLAEGDNQHCGGDIMLVIVLILIAFIKQLDIIPFIYLIDYALVVKTLSDELLPNEVSFDISSTPQSLL